MFTSGNGRKRPPLGDTDGKRSSARLRGKISKKRTDSAEPKPKGGLSSAGASATKENAPNGTADASSATKDAPLLDAPTPPPVPAAAALIFMTKKELRAELDLRKIEVKKSATKDALLEKLGLPINEWNSFRTMKVSQLKEVLKSRGDPVTGKKYLLLERLGVPRGYGQPKWERESNEFRRKLEEDMRQWEKERKERQRQWAKEQKEREEKHRKWEEQMAEEDRRWEEEERQRDEEWEKDMKQMEEEERLEDEKRAEEQRQRDKKWAEEQRRWEEEQAEEDRKWKEKIKQIETDRLEREKKWNEEMEERERKEAEEEKKHAEEDRKLEEEARKRDEEHRQFMEKHRQWMTEHRERSEKRKKGTEEILERARSSLEKAKHTPPEDDPSDESPSIQSHSSDVEAYSENCSSDSDSSTDMDDEDDDEKYIISDEDLSSDVESYSENCSSDSDSSTDINDEDDDEKYIISDEDLFGETPRKECEHCKVRLEWDSCNANYQLCCGKEICNGCMYSRVQTGVKSFVGGASMDRALASTDCPFCGVPGHDTDEEAVERLHKLLEKDPDNGHALHFLAFQHANGNMGLPRDMVKANELWTKAGAELGFVDALNSLANSYKMPRGGFKSNDKKALYYYQCAAMKGHMQARYNCGIFEEENGNMKRAAKHFIISLKGGFNKLNLAESKVRLLHKEGHVSQEELDDALEGYKKYKDEVMTDDRRRARYRWGI